MVEKIFSSAILFVNSPTNDNLLLMTMDIRIVKPYNYRDIDNVVVLLGIYSR